MNCEACAEEIELRHKKIEVSVSSFHEHCMNYGILAVWAASQSVREDMLLSHFFGVFFRLLEENPVFFEAQYLRILATFTTVSVETTSAVGAA